MWVVPLMLIVSLAVVSLTHVFESQADKASAPGQVKKEKIRKRPLANVTIEREGYFIKNAGTPHEFVALKKKLVGEKAPDLSASAIRGEVLEGPTVRYTITLKNRGNINATDIDVLNELDSRFGEPNHFVFRECGKRYKKSFEANQVELSNILVKKDKNCVIQYDVTATANGIMGNWLYLSPAAEGGEEIGPIEATPLKVRMTPENINAEPNEIEEVSDTEILGNAAETVQEASQEEESAEGPADEPLAEEEIPEEELTENNPEETIEESAEPTQDEVSSERIEEGSS